MSNSSIKLIYLLILLLILKLSDVALTNYLHALVIILVFFYPIIVNDFIFLY